MKRSLIAGILIASMGVCFWQCSDESDREASLKGSLNAGAYKLNKALEEIEGSSAYIMLLADVQSSFKSTSSDTTAYLDSILLEGGSTLNFSAIQEGIVDKLYSFISPKSMTWLLPISL